jgi:hypothetical protein
LLILLNAACLAGRNKYQFDSLWCDPAGARTPIYRTRGEHDNHYTIDAVWNKKEEMFSGKEIIRVLNKRQIRTKQYFKRNEKNTPPHFMIDN